MIKDYKGETPKNVTTPEKAKAQKPFYKNWKFWVLTGLMTLFGACSIYGLVLGSQYVKAIERASHIIADAQSGSVAESGMQPNAKRAVNAVSDYYTFDTTLTNFIGRYDLVDNTTGIDEGHPYARVYGDSTNYFFQLGFRIGGTNRQVYFYEWHTTFFGVSLWFNNNPIDVESYFATPLGSAIDLGTSNGAVRVKGNFSLYPEASGEAIGYQDGYQEGYDVGSDVINVNQFFRVVMPVGNDSVQYQSFINGVSAEQGQIVGGTSAPNYREFTRNRNQTLRVDLTLPSGYRAFWSYTPAFTASFPVDDNISLQQSWAVDGVVYLPTWVSSVQIWVGVTSAQVPDLTTQSISVAFDVSHWGDIKVGAYQQGYQQGYVDGQENPTAYQSGYDAGYEDGHDAGEVAGYNRGVADGTSGSKSLGYMFRVAFQLPFDQLYAYLNFNLLGINFASLFSALITVSLGIIVIKKVL